MLSFDCALHYCGDSNEDDDERCEAKARRARTGRSEISAGETMPSATAPAIVPEASPTAEAFRRRRSRSQNRCRRPCRHRRSRWPIRSAIAWTALAEAQTALARGFEEIAIEVTGMTRSGIRGRGGCRGRPARGQDLFRSRRNQCSAGPARGRCDDRRLGQAVRNRRQGGERGVAADPVAARRDLERLGRLIARGPAPRQGREKSPGNAGTRASAPRRRRFSAPCFPLARFRAQCQSCRVVNRQEGV